MTDAASPAAPARAPDRAADNHWQPGEAATHEDPLLDALVVLTRLHGNPFTPEALSAGLPLVDNRLTPSLLPRAAARAGLTARIVRKSIEDITPNLLPAILLLHDRRACVLLERRPDGGARVRFPEAGESADDLSADELAALYTGLVCFVRPRFRFEARSPQVKAVRASHWFWGTVMENWRLYRDTLLAALVVNLFALAIPMFSMTVYDRVVPNHAVETLWVLAVGAMLVLLFDFILRTLRAYIVDTAGKRIDVQLSARIMERVLGLRMDARPASVGSFASNLRAFEGVRDFIASATVTTLIDLPFVLLFLLVMVWISPWLLLPPLVGMLAVLFVTLVAQDKMHELTETTYRASAQRNATLVESLVGLETVKTLSAESLIQRQWERATLFIAQIGGRLKLLSSSTVNFAQFMQQFVNIAVIIVGVYELSEGNMSMGGIIAASMLSGRAMAPLGQVAGLMMQYQNARTSLASVNSHMELPIERPDGASFVHRPSFNGDIEFKDVGFSYPGRDQAVLKKVSFRLKAGEKVAIIGRIGSGKTTIEKLVLGLYQPTEGAIFIDGIDSRQIDPAELRRAIGFVPQDVTLFYGTLKHNIAMGAPFADDSAILAAAELSGVKEFADTHPQGFEMPIGERGESLSGGQRQAVAIARALLNDPPILLLDEPSSSMDHQSEEGLKQRLRRFAASKTMILVTHRTSLLDLVDRLIVLDQGQIVADGPKAQVVEALQQGRIGRAG
ncbi:type I secretion system permease/ATPase [Zoogloea sp.]|uniref:type I secretion system permease/ATPase n=1 Tax=Zoogloea sp. TaxID=49181 RepID=UPI0025D647A9|nr:type I secretion system permease/ATPase [Zoogloea sp.]MCK6392380.1 type I secretion system permease/ATPase [Zoogloea sp.]